METDRWAIDLGSLATEWATICGPIDETVDVDEWTARLLEMQGVMVRLQTAGRWAAGPHDLLSIVGLNRWELAHSAAISWLCTPDAGHGLGAALLETLLSFTGEQVHRGEPVTTVLEEARLVAMAGVPGPPLAEDVSSVDGSEEGLPGCPDGVLTRADVVVRGLGWTLVIEVKVDAGEQPKQAQRLYEGWKDEGDARFIFLSRSGRPPGTISSDLQHVWTSLAWRDLHTSLAALADQADPSAIARPALLDYLRTLRTTF